MKKKTYLSLLVTMTTLGIAGGVYTTNVQADGGEADKALLPIVFMTLDTSGSMSGSLYIQAIQELSGKAITNTYSSGSIETTRFYYTRFPRKQLTCDKKQNKCYYKTVWVCGSSYTATSENPCDYRFTTSGTGTTPKLKEGFNGTDKEFATRYMNNGVIHNYLNTVKFGMAAMCGRSNEKYGHKNNGVTYVPIVSDGSVTDAEKKHYSYGFNNISTTTIWGSHINYDTPTLYPTTSDDPKAVRLSNEAVVTNIRSYVLTGGGTPLAEMLQGLYYMFNNDNTNKDGEIDPGLLLQPKPDGEYMEDERDYAWACRAKAVIAMTDGVPNNTSTPLTWAEKLYRQNVKVFSVAYGSPNATPKSGIGKVMNEIAWKGGTCRTFGHTGDIIDPSDKTAYDNYIKNYNSKTHTPCFYNAYNGIALREAMISIMSELLEGYTSKSKMVSTTAVGKLTTVDDAGKPVNGWYNVYSGYKVNLGAMRNSGLQRETYACRDGKFVYDADLFIDMAKKLDNRLAGCRNTSMFSDASMAGPKGDCITNRAIFVGDYSSRDERFSTGRYALKPEKIHFSDSRAGVIYHGTDPNQRNLFAYNGIKHEEYNIARTCLIADSKKCPNESTSLRDDYYDPGLKNESVTKYIVSPYECKTEVDCIGMSDDADKQYVCDKGKCVIDNTLQNYVSCSANNSSCKNNEVCLNGQCRTIAAGCSKHSDCMSGIVDGVRYETQNQVCHAGQCMTGVLVDGDIRDLMASIPLGAIEYASPVIVGPPSYSYRGSDYVTFKNKYADRDTMMYVPANDGMLHAFILGKNNSSSYAGSVFPSLGTPKIGETEPKKLEGAELWAFIPKAVMRNIHTLTDFGEQKKINVSPVYADVQFPDGDGGGEWHSVIVGGFREGGRGYYALDVTEPQNPKILWEIDHQWQSTSRNIPYPEINNDMAISVAQETQLKEDGLYPFARMGYSYPEAIITNVILDDEIVPVAVLPGGVASGNDTTDCTGFGEDKVCFEDVTGKAVFVVRLNPTSKDDLLVREFQFDTRISGTPSAFPAGFNSIARVIYVGDENGALHRIDVSNPDMNKWKIDGMAVKTEGKVAKPIGDLKPIFDPNNIDVLQGTPRKKYEKITYKPAVSALTSTGFPDIQIVFGSGDSSELSIGPRDLNYTAIAIDHYVNDTIGYQLNNFNTNHEIDAKTQNLDPLVIVFNPTPGIKSQPLDSYGVPDGKKQYFEVWAGKVADEPDKDINLGADKGRSASARSAQRAASAPVINFDIRSGQKMMGPALTYNFKTYFPTYNATLSSGACSDGFASIWAIDDRVSKNLRWKIKTKTQVQNYNNNTLSGATDNGKTATSFDKNYYINLVNGTKVYGLAMTPQAICVKGDKAQVVAPQLIAQTGKVPGVSGASEGVPETLRGAGDPPEKGEMTDIALLSITEDAIKAEPNVLSWASVYE